MPADLKAWPHESSRQRQCKARPGGNQKSRSTIQSFRRRALASDVVWRGGGKAQGRVGVGGVAPAPPHTPAGRVRRQGSETFCQNRKTQQQTWMAAPTTNLRVGSMNHARHTQSCKRQPTEALTQQGLETRYVTLRLVEAHQRPESSMKAHRQRRLHPQPQHSKYSTI